MPNILQKVTTHKIPDILYIHSGLVEKIKFTEKCTQLIRFVYGQLLTFIIVFG